MALLKDSDKEAVRQRLAEMSRKVKMVFVTQEMECQFCAQTHELLNEVSELSDKLELVVLDLLSDHEQAASYNLREVPGLNLVAVDEDGTEHNYGVLFYGVPAGYEFISLLDGILLVSEGDSDLSDLSKAKLKAIDKPVEIQVFVTPTCPYCTTAVHMAHQLAVACPHITGVMVEATEYPHLAIKYAVRGVPKSVFSEGISVEGAVPEEAFVDAARRAGGLQLI